MKDALYVAVGFGVLGFQRAQVHRRQLERLVRDVQDQLRQVFAEPSR